MGRALSIGVIGLFAALLFAAAQSGAPAAQARGLLADVSITDATLARGVDPNTGEHQDRTDVFSQGTVSFVLDEESPELDWIWFWVSMEGGWTAGAYQVTLFVNGMQNRVLAFRVEGEAQMPGPAPTASGVYWGTITNTSAGVEANMQLLLKQDGDQLRGAAIIFPPLMGSGLVEGTVTEGQLSVQVFTWSGSEWEAFLDFSGAAMPDGSIGGEYTIPAFGQSGTWSVSKVVAPPGPG